MLMKWSRMTLKPLKQAKNLDSKESIFMKELEDGKNYNIEIAK